MYNYNYYSNNLKLIITIVYFSIIVQLSQLIGINKTIAFTFHNDFKIQNKLGDRGIMRIENLTRIKLKKKTPAHH